MDSGYYELKMIAKNITVVGGYICPVPLETAAELDKFLGYLNARDVLTILALDRLHLVLEPEL
jgi:hypothetical protein